jgi:hypothetical protein
VSSVILTGDTSGTLTVSAPLVAGSNTVTLPAATGTISLLQMGTAVASTSGTSIDFTGIPAWAKRITVMFAGLSLSGSATAQIQLGDSGGVETTGYLSGCGRYVSGGAAANSTTGLLITNASTSGSVWHGISTIVLINSNQWAQSVSFGFSNGANAGSGGGSKTLSDTLDRIRITSSNGTDTFTAGSINVMWEG